MTPIQISILLGVCFLFLQPSPATSSANFQNLPGFLENKGQIHDYKGNEREDVLFVFEKEGFKLLLGRDFFSYEFTQVVDQACPTRSSEDDDNVYNAGISHFRSDVIRVNILNSNDDVEIISENPLKGYRNFYSGKREPILHVGSFQKIIFKNIYPDIDMMFEIGNAGSAPIHYDFIIHPGADVGNISLKYDCSGPIQITEGGIMKISSPLGEISERIPSSFYLEDHLPVRVTYQLDHEILKFHAVNTSSEKTLLIDPELNWAEYFGGSKDEHIEECLVDHHGNIIISGGAASDGIATNGAYQETRGGSTDFFIAKYRSDGTLVWATYYGGDSSDYAFTMAIDPFDNIYVGGETKSTNGVASPGAYQTSKWGDYDALLLKLDSTGSRLWATYYGGKKKEQLLACAVDSQANVFIAGYTKSTSHVATAGSYQTVYGGGDGDGFLAKFNASGQILFSTYFGGSDEDRFHGLAIDHSGNVIASGTSPSTNKIATNGAYQTIAGGSNDAFLSKFTNKGALKWSTYYGKSNTERGRDCCVDASNNIYLTGFTKSDSGLSSPGAYQTHLQGGYDVFIAKFSSTGARIWATYYGGTENEYAHGIAWRNGLVALSGLTLSTSLIATPDALQPQLAGNWDAYLAVFDDNGTMKWSTYYGGPKKEALGHGYGPNLTFDKNGNLILACSTFSDSLPALNLFHHGTTKDYSDGVLVTITTDFLQRQSAGNHTKPLPGFSVYPNPVSDQCAFQFSATENQRVSFTISDLSGKILLTNKSALIADQILTVKVGNLPGGVYNAEVILSDGRKMSQMFVKE